MTGMIELKGLLLNKGNKNTMTSL